VQRLLNQVPINNIISALTFEIFSRLKEVTKVLHHLTAAMSDLQRDVDFLKSNVRRSEPRSEEAANDCANGGFWGGAGGRGEGVRGRAEGRGAGEATVLNDLRRDVTEIRREMNDFRRDMNDFRRDVNDFRQEMRIKEPPCAPAPNSVPDPNSVVAELVCGGVTGADGRRRWLSKEADKKRQGKERAMARGESTELNSFQDTDAGKTRMVLPKAERQVLGFWEWFRV